MNLACDRGSLLISYREEYMEFAEMILTNLYEITVRSGRYINQIDLYTLKQTCRYNVFERVFGLAMGLAIADLIQLDQEVNLPLGNPIVLLTNVYCSSILTDMAQTIVDSSDRLEDMILTYNLSSFRPNLSRKPLEFTLIIDEIRLNLGMLLTSLRIKSLQEQLRKLFNSSVLVDSRYTFAGLVLAGI